MEKNHLSIRTDKAIHDKLQYIAAYEGRSMSGQILYLILRRNTGLSGRRT